MGLNSTSVGLSCAGAFGPANLSEEDPFTFFGSLQPACFHSALLPQHILCVTVLLSSLGTSPRADRSGESGMSVMSAVLIDF